MSWRSRTKYNMLSSHYLILLLHMNGDSLHFISLIPFLGSEMEKGF